MYQTLRQLHTRELKALWGAQFRLVRSAGAPAGVDANIVKLARIQRELQRRNTKKGRARL